MSIFLPPVAQRRFGTRIRDIHGDHVDDPWDWLRNPSDPEAVAHIEAENAWADHVTAPFEAVRQCLVSEFRTFTVEDDVSAPVREGAWWYFRRYQAGKSYPAHYRLPAQEDPSHPGRYQEEAPELHPDTAHPGEVLLVDENAEAAGQEFFRLTNFSPSPDGTIFAWARDLSGDERWTWIIQHADGQIIDDAVTGAGYGFAWSADGQSFIYTRVDDVWRSYQIWLHTLGTPADQDVLLLWEPDEAFDVWITPSRDPRWVTIHSTSPTTGQGWLWNRESPRSPLLTVTPRLHDVLFRVEPAGDHLLCVHSMNSREGSIAAAPLPSHQGTTPLLAHQGTAPLLTEQGAAAPPDSLAPYGRSVHTPKAYPTTTTAASAAAKVAGEPVEPDPCFQPTPELLGESVIPLDAWVSVREPQPGERILDVEAFAGFAVVSMRSGSLTQVAVHLRKQPAHSELLSSVEGLWDAGRFVEIESPVRCVVSAGVGDFDDQSFLIEHQSVTVPVTAERVEAASLLRHVVKRQEVPGWNPGDYIEERVWVTARDGHTQIPVTLVRHRNVQADGTNPGWMHGYGSYEIPFDAEFDILRLPALTRGVVHAIAHIRGGGEMGRAWYEDGKELRKVNTFTDFIDVANWLVDSGWVAEKRLAAEGRSAGGLLMGAVTNMAPERFAAILAGVPFVDALTTILDPSLPLTVGEWEEWGNPIQDKTVFDLMKSYSPYENVTDGTAYPAIMATTSMNDTRVFYVEPAKWVQRLREATSCDPNERPIVMRTEMVAGHGGRSGRYGRWDARSEEFAFILHHLGIDE